FFSSRRRHTRFSRDWSSDVCSSDLDDKPEVCEGFDLMWRYIELVSGGTRISDKAQLIERLQEKGLNPDSFRAHLQAYDYGMPPQDRKSTRLNSSHVKISYAVFCLKK